MIKAVEYIYKLIDKILPPLKFNLKKKQVKKLSKEEADRWATDILDNIDRNRRRKRGR